MSVTTEWLALNPTEGIVIRLINGAPVYYCLDCGLSSEPCEHVKAAEDSTKGGLP